MKVLFYGRLADALGPEAEINVPHGCTVAALRDRLIAEHPQAEAALRSKRARAFIGDTLVHDDQLLDPAQPVEFLPPVSGG